MKFTILSLLLLSLAACKERGGDPDIDSRSVEYNNRAIEKIQRFIHEGLPDTTAFAQAGTIADTARIIFGEVVDSCQRLLDSAVMYSLQYYLYYAQKARLYVYCMDYENAYKWALKALERKDFPGLRIGAGLFAHRLGNEREAQTHYRRAIEQFEACDSLSQPYVMDYVFALSLSGEKEKALRVIDSLACDTLLRRQLLSLAENPQDAIDESIP